MVLRSLRFPVTIDDWTDASCSDDTGYGRTFLDFERSFADDRRGFEMKDWHRPMRVVVPREPARARSIHQQRRGRPEVQLCMKRCDLLANS
jgi:hypothetical protein